MVTTYAAGGYVDGWCTKCKLELAHTIIAVADNFPKRVKCNTCNGEHSFRPKSSAKPSEPNRTRLKSPSGKTKTKVVTYDDYIGRLTGYDLSGAKKYSINGNFKKDEILDHHKFGIGIVLSVIQNNKIEILFKDGNKLLIQNQ